MTNKEAQVKELAHIITSEQCSGLPHVDTGSKTFAVSGGLPHKLIRAIAEQIYHQGYRK